MFLSLSKLQKLDYMLPLKELVARLLLTISLFLMSCFLVCEQNLILDIQCCWWCKSRYLQDFELGQFQIPFHMHCNRLGETCGYYDLSLEPPSRTIGKFVPTLDRWYQEKKGQKTLGDTPHDYLNYGALSSVI